MSALRDKTKAWLWVPTAYLAEGGPYMLVASVSVVFLKSIDISNSRNAFWTSLIMLPWAIKPLWTPLLDLYSTKRWWILGTQLCMAVILTGLACAATRTGLTWLMVAFFLLLAFTSATHDAAVDGLYLEALSSGEQAFFSGIRSTFYRVASIAVQGGLVMLVGLAETSTGDIRLAWAQAFFGCAALLLLLTFWHTLTLPHPRPLSNPEAASAPLKALWQGFSDSFGSFFRKPGWPAILLFLFFYRIAESQLGKMAAPFLQDPVENGGMGLTLEEYGLLYGTFGVTALTAGGIIGGVLAAWRGFRAMIWVFVCAINLPDIVYVYLATYQPEALWITGSCIAIEQFGYGMGYTGFVLVMLAFAEDSGRFKTSHFALMAGMGILGMSLAGMISGVMQTRLGYTAFFWYVMLCTIPSFAVTRPLLRLLRPDFGLTRPLESSD